MDSSSYHELADDLLESLCEAIEEADEDGVVDPDLVEGVLTITLEDGGEYVINKHAASSEVWVSSPESGASHFAYQEDDDEWINTDGAEFKEMISAELANLADIDVEF